MSMPTVSTMEIALVVVLVTVTSPGIAAFLLQRKRQTERPRTQFVAGV